MAAFAGTYVPSQEKQPAPDSFGQAGYGQQDPYAGSQGGYQPEYGQQGGYEDGGYSQGYDQQPTSYSNQMWACPVKPQLEDGEYRHMNQHILSHVSMHQSNLAAFESWWIMMLLMQFNVDTYYFDDIIIVW